MTTTSAALQTGIRTRRMQAVVGQPAFADWLNKIKDGVNSAPQAAQVETTTINVYGAGAVYQIIFDGMTYEYTESGDVNVAGVAASIIDDWNTGGFPPGRGVAAATTGGGAAIVFTGTYPGVIFDVDVSADAKISTVTTLAAAEAEAIEFGRALMSLGYATSGEYAVGDTMQQVAKLRTASFTAQAESFGNFAALAAGRLDCVVDARMHDLGMITASAPYAVSIAATLAALKVAIDAALVSAGLDTYIDTNVVAGPDGFEFDVAPGFEGFEYEAMISHDLGLAAITKTSNVGTDTSALRAWGGVSIARYDTTSQNFATAGDPSYDPNSGVPFLRSGFVWVDRPDDGALPALGAQVYVSGIAGADAGKLFAQPAADRIPLPRTIARWERDGRIATDGLSLLNLGNF